MFVCVFLIENKELKKGCFVYSVFKAGNDASFILRFFFFVLALLFNEDKKLCPKVSALKG